MTDTFVDDRPTSEPAPARSGSRSRLVLVVLLVAGVLVDVALQTPADGFALFAATLVVAVGLAMVGGVRSLAGRLLMAAAVVPAFFLFVRTSPWVVSVDVIAVGLLLALGASMASGQRFFDLSFGQTVRHLTATVGAIAVAPARIVEAAAAALPAPNEHRRSQYAAVGRGVGLAFPVVLVLGVLLASADAVFASLLDLDVDLSRLPLHAMLIAVGMWLAAGLFVQSERGRAIAPANRPFTVGPVEGALVLGGLIAVYSLFAVARLLVTLRGDEYVVETTGLTYADYARSGFFQLLWAAGITLVVLLGLRAVIVLPSRTSRLVFAALSLVAVALTVVVVHTAIDRLGLYENAFGLTMLRLYSTTFAWWIGGVFVLTGLALAGVRRDRQWLAGAVLCSALVPLLSINVTNPERVVVERNVELATRGAAFDVGYAVTLSDDAVPALVDALPLLAPDEQRASLRLLCVDDDANSPTWNIAAQRARDALDEVC